ncbi:UDP-N-acetylmuramate--L-alanine ligase [Candidatus Legionella polyplacis]|uniref:UDP-N-acetylmuramate--L-alanine ligase n=1 Tax=Candidatus Legionella polyplacis TaxID=2005262 RepID=A0ABZ2GXN7_9GAMM
MVDNLMCNQELLYYKAEEYLDNINFFKYKNIHFIGIGGIGMSGIAKILCEKGYNITGSDLEDNHIINSLRLLGIKISIGHKAINVLKSDLVVKSSAISMENIEIKFAIKYGIPIISRGLMLAKLLYYHYNIIVSGSHGKTTTSGLIISIFTECNIDISFVIGGILNVLNVNAKLGKSRYFIAEADESDASFLFLKPDIAVVTNIEKEHLDNYFNNFNNLSNTFINFINNVVPSYGLSIICIDNKEIKRKLLKINGYIRTYGFSKDADYRACNWVQIGLFSHFTVHRPKPFCSLRVKIILPGRHNVLNVLASIAVSTEIGINDKYIINGLLKFKGVNRRFHILGKCQFKNGEALIISDYGHHPNEILSTINAIRSVWPNKRLIHVFQPHRYSRLKLLFSEFVNVLALSEELFLLNVFSLNENFINCVDSKDLLDNIRQRFLNYKVTLINNDEIFLYLNLSVNDGDIILMQGAGNIHYLALNLLNLHN